MDVSDFIPQLGGIIPRVASSLLQRRRLSDIQLPNESGGMKDPALVQQQPQGPQSILDLLMSMFGLNPMIQMATDKIPGARRRLGQ